MSPRNACWVVAGWSAWTRNSVSEEILRHSRHARPGTTPAHWVPIEWPVTADLRNYSSYRYERKVLPSTRQRHGHLVTVFLTLQPMKLVTCKGARKLHPTVFTSICLSFDHSCRQSTQPTFVSLFITFRTLPQMQNHAQAINNTELSSVFYTADLRRRCNQRWM